MLKLISWNIARRAEPWRLLPDSGCDIALLQEASAPPADIADRVDCGPAPWHTGGAAMNRAWRSVVVRLSDRVRVEWLDPKSIDEARPGELAVSRAGTLDAAIVTPETGEPFTVVSLYGAWEQPLSALKSSWIYADASVHRLISDLSALIGHQRKHRIIAAGDLNILHGHGEYGSRYWADRYATVFRRMETLGLTFAGPQAPDGRSADPWPDELPKESKNVPTYHTNRQTPATSTRQLDFVFASTGLASQVRVKALNEPEDWGPSDHCRIEIDVE